MIRDGRTWPSAVCTRTQSPVLALLANWAWYSVLGSLQRGAKKTKWCGVTASLWPSSVSRDRKVDQLSWLRCRNKRTWLNTTRPVPDRAMTRSPGASDDRLFCAPPATVTRAQPGKQPPFSTATEWSAGRPAETQTVLHILIHQLQMWFDTVNCVIFYESSLLKLTSFYWAVDVIFGLIVDPVKAGLHSQLG